MNLFLPWFNVFLSIFIVFDAIVNSFILYLFFRYFVVTV